jgi:hypothetical protein
MSSVVYPKHRCYCGSEHCGPFQCRFYKSEDEMKLEQEEFYKQWAQMEARDSEQA